MPYNHIASLYQQKPTLSSLYQADSALFSTMQLPTGISNSNIADYLLMQYGQLETIFTSAAEAKAGFQIWSVAKNPDWSRMWAALQENYKPLENYSMTEKMTNDETIKEYGHSYTRTDDLTHSKTGTDTRTPNITDTETPNITDTETPNITETDAQSIYGFNSNSAVPQSDSTSERTGTNTTRRTGTNTTTRTGTDRTQYNTSETDSGTQTNAESGSDTETRNYTLTRSGNIGVTTSQQMLEAEMELRCKWNMYAVIADGFYSEFCVKVW